MRQALSGLKSVAVSCSKDYTKNGLDDDENDENLENFTEKRTERKLFRSSPVKDHLDADGSLSLDFIRRNVGEDSESPRESMFEFMKTGFYDRAYDESESSDDDKSTSPKCQIPNYQPVDDIDSGLVLVTDSSNTSFDVEEKTVDNNVANDSDYYCEYEEEDSKELFSYDEIREQIIANVLKVFNNGLREEVSLHHRNCFSTR